MLSLTINGTRHSVDALAEAPPVWATPQQLQTAGAKFGCATEGCGAFRAHPDIGPVHSRQTALSDNTR